MAVGHQRTRWPFTRPVFNAMSSVTFLWEVNQGDTMDLMPPPPPSFSTGLNTHTQQTAQPLLFRGCRNGKKNLGVSNTPYDGGRWVTDGGWCVTDGGWWVTDGGWWVTDGGWCVTDGGWWVTDGGWWVTDGGWWVTDGGWWVTDGGWWVATKHQRVDAIVKKKRASVLMAPPAPLKHRSSVCWPARLEKGFCGCRAAPEGEGDHRAARQPLVQTGARRLGKRLGGRRRRLQIRCHCHRSWKGADGVGLTDAALAHRFCFSTGAESWHQHMKGGGDGGGGVGTRSRYLIVCLWQRLSASRHCSF